MIFNEAQKNIEKTKLAVNLFAIQKKKKNKTKPKPTSWADTQMERNVISNQKSFNQFQFPQVIDIWKMEFLFCEIVSLLHFKLNCYGQTRGEQDYWVVIDSNFITASMSCSNSIKRILYSSGKWETCH